MSLEYAGQSGLAEEEFRKMKARYSYFEPRYQYGLFLQRASREEEARLVFKEIVEEAPHLSSREKRDSRAWIVQAKEKLKKG
jgi:hypothetical protein